MAMSPGPANRLTGMQADRVTAFGEWIYESLAVWMYRRRGWI